MLSQYESQMPRKVNRYLLKPRADLESCFFVEYTVHEQVSWVYTVFNCWCCCLLDSCCVDLEMNC